LETVGLAGLEWEFYTLKSIDAGLFLRWIVLNSTFEIASFIIEKWSIQIFKMNICF